MGLLRYGALFSDLLNFLPGKSTIRWREIGHYTPGQPVVILVSGFAASYRTLSVIRKRLIRDGFHVVVLSMDWHVVSEGITGLDKMSEKLSYIILHIRKKFGRRGPKVFLVAHSAGGLVARHYVQRLGGSHYCDGLITLATPHQGTWMAAMGLASHLIVHARGLWQLMPMSQFIRKLNETPIPPDFRMVSIYSKDDLLCSSKAMRLPESIMKDSRVESVEVQDISHHDFLLSKRLYQMILRYLKEGTESARTG